MRTLAIQIFALLLITFVIGGIILGVRQAVLEELAQQQF